jgi:hypothetical protein
MAVQKVEKRVRLMDFERVVDLVRKTVVKTVGW